MGESQSSMDSGAAGHVMPERTFPRVKLERKRSPKKFVAANCEQIRDSGENTFPFKTNEGFQMRITFRCASVVKPLISMQKLARTGNIGVLDEKYPHIRNTRDGTMIKLDVNNRGYTMDMWICLDESSPVFSWQGQFVVKPLSTSLQGPHHCVKVKNQKTRSWKKLKEQK